MTAYAMTIKEALRADAKRAASPIQAAYITLIKECERLERAAQDAVYPDDDYRESPEYLRIQVTDGAHAIIDYALELAFLLKARDSKPSA